MLLGMLSRLMQSLMLNVHAAATNNKETKFVAFSASDICAYRSVLAR